MLANGQMVSRGDQYSMIDQPPNRGWFASWQGHRYTNHNLLMQGGIWLNGDSTGRYDEVLYDNAKRNEIIMRSTTQCTVAEN